MCIEKDHGNGLEVHFRLGMNSSDHQMLIKEIKIAFHSRESVLSYPLAIRGVAIWPEFKILIIL